jgi:subtilisin family serine protease
MPGPGALRSVRNRAEPPMKSNRLRPNRLSLTIAAAVSAACFGGIAAAYAGETSGAGPAVSTHGSPHFDSGNYIVRLSEPALAGYHGGTSGLAAPARTGGQGHNRLDVHAASSKKYVDHLKTQQGAALQAINKKLGRNVHVSRSYQHAFNGLAVKVSEDEAKRIATLPGVTAVTKAKLYQAQTDSGPQWIGAPAVWSGQADPGIPGTKGEGIVVGEFDTGINFLSKSFVNTGSDGYAMVNPLGAGNYLGTCAAGQQDTGFCNNKIIGAYDFSYDVVCPADACVSGYYDTPGAIDINGHGSHTASTAAGNATNINFLGQTVAISGVAPHANIIAYQVCFTDTSSGGALCEESSVIAAADQVIQDGIVDVVNYSLSGGTDAWSDDVALSLLNLTDAGVFVAAAAGNGGPDPSTVQHQEPWTMSVAALTHDRVITDVRLDVTSPGPVPPALTNIEGNNSDSHPIGATPISGPLAMSGTNPGACTNTGGFAGTFTPGFIALLPLDGMCPFQEKMDNAFLAGAIAGVEYQNQAGGTGEWYGSQYNLPGEWISREDGEALRDWLSANPGATVTLSKTAKTFNHQHPEYGDILAYYSARGPATSSSLLKPEIGAPGVQILAAWAGNAGVYGTPADYQFEDGTSMATPHVTGAAALVRSAHPDWSVYEVKSALMLTAKNTGLLKDDGLTPTDPFDVGAGRVDVAKAVASPLVMDETSVRMALANPVVNGDPTKLNLAELTSGQCIDTCDWTRTVRNVSGEEQTFTASVNVAGVSLTITPNQFTLAPGATQKLAIHADATAAAEKKYYNGTLTLTPAAPSAPPPPADRIFGDDFDGTATLTPAIPVHMPVSIYVRRPFASITAVPAQLNATVPSNTNVQQQLAISNTGTISLTWDTTANATFPTLVHDESDDFGFMSAASDYSIADNGGIYEADDFVLTAPSKIHTIRTLGWDFNESLFLQPAFSWAIYADQGGHPAGDPETSPGNALWTYTTTPAAIGVTFPIYNIWTWYSLDLDATGQNLTLPAGHYWLSVWPTYTNDIGPVGNYNRWTWWVNYPVRDLPSMIISPTGLQGQPTTWTALNSLNQFAADLVFQIDGEKPCGAPWLVVTPSNGGVVPAGTTNATVQMNVAGFAPGTYTAYVCVGSNDTDQPIVSVPVSVTVGN